MTAIACAYSPAGFAIAADGRRTNAATCEVLTDCAQKIHLFSNHRVQIAYAFKGATISHKPSHPALDLTACAADILQGEDIWSFRSAADFAIGFGNMLCCDLVGYNGSLALPDSCLGTSLMIAGYVDREPVYATLGLLSEDRILNKLNELATPINTLKVFSGSRIVLEALEEEESWKRPQTVADAYKLVTSYVQTCIKHADDLSECKGMGGHLHGATVCPEGAKWGDRPLDSTF